MVSKSQNAFIEVRQFFYVVLITNEVVGSMLKSKACGVMCKLDIVC